MPEGKKKPPAPWRPKGPPYFVLSKAVIAHGYSGVLTAMADALEEMQRDPFIEAPRIESKFGYITQSSEELVNTAVEAQGMAYQYRSHAERVEGSPADAALLRQLAEGGLTALAASLRLSPRAKALRRAQALEELTEDISGILMEVQAAAPSLLAYLRHHQRAKAAEQLQQRLAVLRGRFRPALPPPGLPPGGG